MPLDHNTYSQNNEDQIIFDYFYPNFSDKTILEVGANDGITLSNSYRAIKNGMSACLIEPCIPTFNKLQELHKDKKNVSCFNYGIGNMNCILKFYESGELLGTGDNSLVSTFEFEETKRWTSANIKFTESDLPVKTFRTFLKQSPIKQFDCISIDVEGLEYEVLRQINLKSIGCKMLIVEFNGIVPLKQKFINFVLSFGFELVNENAENLIFTII